MAALMSAGDRHVVLGLGNKLCQDESLGLHALAALERRLGGRADVEYVDGGTLGLSLLPLVESASHLLVLDAADAGETPGTPIELTRDDIPLHTGLRLSQHQIGFQEVLGLARVRGQLPEHIHLVGAQPADISLGTELTPAVARVLPQVVERAVVVLDGWGLLHD